MTIAIIVSLVIMLICVGVLNWALVSAERKTATPSEKKRFDDEQWEWIQSIRKDNKK
jgi:hypothetical protein